MSWRSDVAPTLNEGDVRLRPLKASDARAWQEVRRRNQAWLGPWDATVPDEGVRAGEVPPSFHAMTRRLRAEAREGRVGSPIGVGAWDTFRGSFSRVNFRALPVGRDAPDGLGGADALAREDGARGDGGGGGRHGVLFVVGAREVRGVSETGETRRIGAAKSWGKDLVKKKGSKRTSRDSIHVKKRSAGKTERPENVGFCCLAGW